MTNEYNDFLGTEEINWDDVSSETSGYEPLPEGSYLMQIEEAKVEKNDKGAVVMNLTYKVVDKNRNVWDYLTLVDVPGYTMKPGQKATPSQIGKARVKTFLELKGINPKDFKFSECFVLNGLQFTGKLKIDLYNPSKPKNKLAGIKKNEVAKNSGDSF